MAEGFGQYSKKSSTPRVNRLKRELEKMDVKDPEDIMMLIMEIFRKKPGYQKQESFILLFIIQKLQTLNMTNIH